MNFLTNTEKKISLEFEKKGFIIKKSCDKDSLIKIRSIFFDTLYKELRIKKKISEEDLFNKAHQYIKVKDLNKLRLNLINKLGTSQELKKLYYDACKEYLNILIGNELVMQKKISLSIQLPKDDSSILPIHSDVWSGVSPYDIVVWIPLVNCYKTKSMFILSPNNTQNLVKNLENTKNFDASKIYKQVKKKLNWIKINFGDVLIFNQHLPHGNIINKENETRWSLNCRFKNVFTPYVDKKIGEFYEPITLRVCSKLGMRYNLPKIK